MISRKIKMLNFSQILKIESYFVLVLVILVLTKQLFYNEMDAVIIFYCRFLR